MVAEPLVRVRCSVCGESRHAVVCPAEEVRSHLGYLRRFHRRRLRPGAPAAALADRAEFTQDDDTDIVACRTCGLVFRNPRPTDEAVARAYSADTYDRERLEALFIAQLELYRPKARRLSGWLQPGARVVEVGSFVGGFLAAGRERSWEMLGVDPGEEVAGFCRERGLRVIQGRLTDVTLAEGSVDAVAIWNTLDQLPDPELTLAAACQLVRRGGVLALRVPNGACFRWSSAWIRRLPGPLDGWLRAAMAWNNLLAFPYLHGYTVPTLDRLMLRHGMRRIAVSGDTLARLADAQTKRWAAWEEEVLKLLWRAAARLEGSRRSSRLIVAPWLDAYYRRADA
jgi:SAM-dependent methyltransferase